LVAAADEVDIKNGATVFEVLDKMGRCGGSVGDAVEIEQKWSGWSSVGLL